MLHQGDLGEYNQCQSQLKHLYEHGLPGHPEEFMAYRILYLLHTRNRRGLIALLVSASRRLTLSTDINALLAHLTAVERQDESVRHALQVRQALATSNYHQFFQLFNSAPKMGAYLMDHFLARERMSALVVMSKA